MLPTLLLRSSSVSSRALLSPKPYLSRQTSLHFSSPSSSPSKRMEGDRTPDRPPGRRRSSYGRGSVSSGKSSMSWGDGSSKSSSVDFRNKSSHSNRSLQRQTSPERVKDSSDVRSTESDSVVRPFDICKSEIRGLVKLNKSIFEQNRERRKELEHTKEVPQHKHLRSGMILLKNHIGYHDQVRIIKRCREFGVGVGGFYTPGYSDGSKLHLQMMCLGKNWDPESRLYEGRRPFDGTTPPEIPEEFRELVDGAIQASHDYLRQSNKRMNVEVELPRMSPDLCIVNFYSKNGRLGLHQDKDESTESLAKGLPVVSFSLGDSADFLFGEKRDADLAEKVLLESGDVLIFGGKSRHLFHGVSTIHENTAPMRLIEETKLKPGRLNLTFRQY